MTGRDLIIYILANDLEDESVFKDGRLLGFMSVVEVAEKMNVGVSTVYAWIAQGRLNCIVMHGVIYIPANFETVNER